MSPLQGKRPKAKLMKCTFFRDKKNKQTNYVFPGSKWKTEWQMEPASTPSCSCSEQKPQGHLLQLLLPMSPPLACFPHLFIFLQIFWLCLPRQSLARQARLSWNLLCSLLSWPQTNNGPASQLSLYWDHKCIATTPAFNCFLPFQPKGGCSS